jgi:hypothetical protein
MVNSELEMVFLVQVNRLVLWLHIYIPDNLKTITVLDFIGKVKRFNL